MKKCNKKTTAHKPYGPYEKYFKRTLDVICVLTAIILFWWLYIIVALLVRIKLGSPVLFTQDRPGRDEKIFKLYKFRTMTDEKDSEGNLLSDEKRLTKFGKLLRSTSLDELPEMWNILKGDMSLVGPRPQLVKDMVFMTSKQRERHLVLPGLTGLAQINGRNNISWEDKLRWDLRYMRHITFRMDIVILLKTVFKVLKCSDIQQNGMETAEDYGDYLLRRNKISKKKYYEKQELSKKILTEVQK